MADEKLSYDEVPHKFAEWLLTMGCPPDKVPSVDKVTEMCRGQYYMVWRSLMEHVEPKKIITNKRLQVFCDDVQKCQTKFGFTQRSQSVVTPEELTLWRQHSELKRKVTGAETRIAQAQHNLQLLIENTSNKLSHRNTSHRRLQDLQRRTWLLQQVGEELKANKTKLEETKTITESFTSVEDTSDIELKLDTQLSCVKRQTRSAASASLSSVANPIASSSLASTSTDHDAEEAVASLVQSRGDVLWPRLLERRARLPAVLTDTHTHTHYHQCRVSPQSVVSHTAALHITLGLEALKNKVLVEQTQKQLSDVVSQLNTYLTGESCELIVVQCERVRTEARVGALRTLLAELVARRGIFVSEPAGDPHTINKQIQAIDKAIMTKRDEMKRLVESLISTERKIQNVRKCLVMLFSSFHDDGDDRVAETFRGQICLPQDSIKSLREFYEESKAKRRSKMELSMVFEVSDNSFSDPMAEDPKFADELRIYLKKFNLEKNRKLVLETGDKIWIFETLRSQLTDLYTRWQSDNVTCQLVCPSVSLSSNLRQLALDISTKECLEGAVKQLERPRKYGDIVDITTQTEEENKTIDKVKKRLNENLLGLQKTAKTLDLGLENLAFWSDNKMKKYISKNRIVNGMSYKDGEDYYLENLKLYI